MKNIAFLLLLFISSSYGQFTNHFEWDENDKIHYEKVISIDGFSADELYTRSKEFFANSFKSANDVIQMDDKSVHSIIGKASSSLNIQSGKHIFPAKLLYTLRIECKEGKYRYQIYGFRISPMNGSEFPAEIVFNKEAEDRFNSKKATKNGKVVGLSYRDETKRSISELITLIETSMLKPKSEW